MKLQRRFATALGYIAGNFPMKRSFDALPDDCMLVSYPRSGSTWLRFLLSNVRFGHESPTTFDNLNDRIPYALRPAASVMRKLPRPRILKSHSAFDCQFRKVVLLVRDPRDAVISYYHYHRRRGKIDESCSLDEYIPMCVRGEVDSYGAWGENVGSWLGARLGTEDFYVATYESLKADTKGELGAICEFLALPTDDQTLQNAVFWSSPEKMNPRKATPGEWRDVLSVDSVQLIEQHWGRVMESLGYSLDVTQQAIKVSA